jgi:hypothetical protein
MNGHHLILGELTDFITGEVIKDTHDERHRQKIARLLVNQKGYAKTDIESRKPLVVETNDKKALLKVDFIITLAGQISMVVKYGPGSLVTRRRVALALSRLVAAYQVPVAVITNGLDAEIISGPSGAVIDTGIEAIPSKHDLTQLVAGKVVEPITKRQAEMESRILYCYEVDDSCECDDDICRL